MQIYRKSMNNEITRIPSPFENNKPSQNFSILIGLYIIGYVFANVIGLVCYMTIGHKAFYQIGNLDFTDHNILMATYVGQVLGSLVTFILPALIFTMFVTREKLEYLRFNHGSKFILFILAAILMVCANPLIDFMADLNSKIPFPSGIKWLEQAAEKEQQAFLANQGWTRFLANVFMIGLLAAFCEELFFRAVLQKIMIKWTNSIHWGVWITAIIFSAVHLEFYGFIPRVFMGVYLGYLFVWTRSIWVPMLAHFINNSFVVIMMFYKPELVNSDKIVMGNESMQYVYVGISTLIVAVTLWLIYRLRDKTFSEAELT